MNMTVKSRSYLVPALLTLLILFIFWITLAPAQLGGWVTYAIVDGSSMEPGFTSDDLLLVRGASDYGVGDAVIYHDPNMDRYIFHRIVGMELDRFVLQGDNNSWLDSYHPNREEVIGRLWFSIPKIGKAMAWLRMPINLSLVVGLLGGVLMFDLFKRTPRKKEKGNLSPNLSGVTQVFIFGSAVFALLFFAAGVYSFLQPLEKSAENISYQQDGNYYYSATGTPGVYDTDVVRSGEPVFPKLTCFLNIGFTYNLLGDRLQNVTGVHKMYARILDEQSGWQRTLPLTPETAFTGTSYFSMATLDLCQVESLVNLVEAETGLKQTSYTLEVVSDVSFIAAAEGNPVSDAFSPALVFKYDKVHFYLANADSEIDPLHSSKAGLAGSSESQANTISLLGLVLPVWLIRFISLAGFLFSSLVLISLGFTMYRTASRNEDALIRLKYAPMIVDVYEQPLAPTSALVDVTTFDDLARLAERHGTMILHMVSNFLNFYFVQSGGTTYRYVVSAGRKGLVVDESAAGQREARVETVSDVSPEPVYVAEVEEKSLTPADQPIHTFPAREEYLEEESSEPQPAFVDEAHYVIETGEIEFEMSQQETVYLRKIRF